MTEAPKVGLKLKIFARLIVSPFLSKSLPPGVQEKRRRKTWGQKGPKSAGFIRVEALFFY